MEQDGISYNLTDEVRCGSLWSGYSDGDSRVNLSSEADTGIWVYKSGRLSVYPAGQSQGEERKACHFWRELKLEWADLKEVKGLRMGFEEVKVERIQRSS